MFGQRFREGVAAAAAGVDGLAMKKLSVKR